MAYNKVTIDVEARFVDNITGEANKVNKTIDDLERRKPKVVVDAETATANTRLDKVENKLDDVAKRHPNPTVSVNDEASSKLVTIMDKAKSLANKVVNIPVKVKENGTLDTLSKMDEKIRGIMGRGNSQTFTMKMRDFITHPLKSITSKLLNVKTLIAGIATGFAAKKFVIDPVKQYADYEDLVTQFSVLLGSQQKAAKRIDDLTSFAGQTPFTRDEIYQASRVLETQTQGALATPESTGGLRMIGDIAAATGKEYTQVATYMGRLYTEVQRGAQGQKMAMGDSLAFLREAGALSAEQEKNIQKIASGSGTVEQKWEQIAGQFSRFDGMMLEMSDQMNNLMLGVKSFVSNNIFKKLGEGFSSSLKPFLKDFRTWRSENSDLIARMGNKIKNFAAKSSEVVLEAVRGVTSKAFKIMQSSEFKNADLFGKIGMVWNGAIKNPFEEWWNGKVKPWWNSTVGPWLKERAKGMGETLGQGLSNAVMGVLNFIGGNSGMIGDATTIGGNFAIGFVKGLDFSGLTDAIVQAIQNVFSNLPLWAKALFAGRMIGGAANMANTAIGGMGTLIGGAKTLLGGAGGAAGGAGGAAGGVMAGARAGKGLLGAGVKFAGATGGIGAGTTTAGTLGAAGLGLAGIGGAIAGTGTAIKGGMELYQGFKEKDDTKKTTGTMKLAGVGAGAAIGTAILPGLGTAIGAGVGAVGGILLSKQEQKRAAEEATTLKELEDLYDTNTYAAEKYDAKMAEISKNISNSFGDISLSADEVRNVIEKRLGKAVKGMDEFSSASTKARSSMDNLASSSEELNKWNWKAGLGIKFNKDEKKSFKAALKDYIEDAQSAVENEHYQFTAAVSVLLDPKSKTGKEIIEGGDAYYSKVQAELDANGKTLTKKLKIALKDGKIDADEEKILQKYYDKQAEILDKINSAESDAELESLKLKFGEGSLDEASFNKLLEETQTWLADNEAQLTEALTASITSLKLQLDEGAITQEEYDKQVQALTEGKTAKVKNLQAKATDMIMEVGGDSLEATIGDDAKEILSSKLEQTLLSGETVTLQELAVDASEASATAASETKTTVDKAFDAAFAGGIHTRAAVTVDATSTTITGLPAGSITVGNGGTLTNPTVTGSTGKIGKFRGGLVYPSGMNVPGFSNGGTVRGGAQLITVAEEGSPEMIIPLSSQRRKRGLDLWMQAGHMMGVPGFANGGIVGGNADEGIRYQNTGASASASSQGAQINVGGVTVEVNVDGGGDNPNIASAIAAQGEEIAETVAGILAEALGSQFENTPNKGVA